MMKFAVMKSARNAVIMTIVKMEKFAMKTMNALKSRPKQSVKKMIPPMLC